MFRREELQRLRNGAISLPVCCTLLQVAYQIARKVLMQLHQGHTVTVCRLPAGMVNPFLLVEHLETAWFPDAHIVTSNTDVTGVDIVVDLGLAEDDVGK